MIRLTLRAAAALALALAMLVAVQTPAAAATTPGIVGPLKNPTQDWAGKSLKVNWPTVPNASGYETKWTSDPKFVGAVYKSTTTNSVWLTGIQPKKTYYVVVRAKSGSTVGAWSKTLKVSLVVHSVGVFSNVTATPTTGGFSVSWDAVPDATDYRVRWSAGPNENRVPDRWQQHFSAWMSAFKPAKLSYFVPTSDTDLTSVQFGNPTFIRVQARNTYFSSTYIRQSAQVHGWPRPTSPSTSGSELRVASYNVMCSSCEPTGAPKWSERASAIAQTINKRDPDILFTQEANGDSSGVGSAQAYLDLQRRLSRLRLVDSAPLPADVSVAGTRLFYDPNKMALLDHGRLRGIKNYRFFPESVATDNNIPWAEFEMKDGTGSRFLAIGAQYGIPSASYSQSPKSLLGLNSSQLLSALDRLVTIDSSARDLPVLFGGDLNDQRYPEDETDGAQPTLVRGGFYDTSASIQRTGTAKPTYNKYKPSNQQIDDPNGDGIRIDYLLERGFSGSKQFTNNWNPGTSTIGSDHNMIDATVMLPLGK